MVTRSPGSLAGLDRERLGSAGEVRSNARLGTTVDEQGEQMISGNHLDCELGRATDRRANLCSAHITPSWLKCLYAARGDRPLPRTPPPTAPPQTARRRTARGLAVAFPRRGKVPP